ncbi:MAG: hypothetical protein IJX16_02545 [Clostridia bacterium]|nr:hypothetical protein [Clostridia bacterium]
MKEWIFSIGATVLLVSIITLILPDGKIGKFIKSIFSILILMVTIKPLISIDKSNINYESIFDVVDIKVQENYINYTFEERKKSYEYSCQEILIDLGIENAIVEIIYENSNMEFKILSVKINLINSVIKSYKEHIFIIEEIKKEITSYLNIDDSILVIYE